MEKCGAPIIYVVDDDADVRDGLKALFESVGLRCEVFGLDFDEKCAGGG